MTSAKVDRWDRALLAIMSDMRYEFTRNAREERRAYNLSMRGLVERKWLPFVQHFGKGTTTFKYGYKRTPAGKAAAP